MKQAKIKAEPIHLCCEIRPSLQKPQVQIPQKQINSSRDVSDILYNIWDQDSMEMEERFMIVYLNRANIITGFSLLGIGVMSSVAIDTKKIMTYALIANANAIIIAHNHPSGNRRPSEMDIKLTNKAIEAGKLLDIKVLDHIILRGPMGDNGYTSMADEMLARF